MKTNRLGIGAALAATAAMIAACTTPTPEAATSGATSASEGPWTIGVSNAFVGSEYRTQMIEDIQSVFDEYKQQGLVKELVLENADADANGQIQQIRNLINKRVDVIIVDPNSATALSAVFEEAVGQGIKVYAIDQAVESTKVTNIGIDQKELGKASAEWFAEQVGEGAEIAVVSGTTGNPATEARWAGAKEVFDAKKIKVVATADGGWDQATGQTVATQLLATYPNIKGIWTYDGMAQGVLRAVQAAGKDNSFVVAGEARVGFMRMWSELKDKGFKSVGVVNPPGTGGTALHFAIAQLQGKTVDPAKITDGHTIVLPLQPLLTNDTFDAEWAKVKDKPDTYVLDSVLTAEQVAAFLK
ncbi:substrate-binding domain-containing protein [Schaalia sp. 19OD2882]|uniref:substrate-binding domain-containing protein n=1 Tax=Schaalia sp. 19OD2882 TaxID=2794089 RepID=UPI001C1ED9A8|nr:substrate-binding domain-containing protein [Schaalia sp. 19OD2882]QWW19590.1 substrate-binding domain-containing protein [Schaalia sp. 19OD2882]